MSWQIPGVPRHLTGMLGGGLLGAGLGYGAGWLGSRILPKSWNRSRLPKTLAILGGLAGAAPGLATIGHNAIQGHSLADDSLLQMPPNQVKRYSPTQPIETSGAGGPQRIDAPNPWYDPNIKLVTPGEFKAGSAPYAHKVPAAQLDSILKDAVSRTGYELAVLEPPGIPVDQFNQVLWQDPRVAGRLSTPMRAATTGLLESAWYERDRRGSRPSRVRSTRPKGRGCIELHMRPSESPFNHTSLFW